jgi:Cd2+/Zn2+-exporting ATPase
VALMADDLSRLPYLIRFSHRNWSVIRQNLALSVVVIGSLIVGAVSGVFSLPVAVLAHEASEFVVIASGLRMLKA